MFGTGGNSLKIQQLANQIYTQSISSWHSTNAPALYTFFATEGIDLYAGQIDTLVKYIERKKYFKETNVGRFMVIALVTDPERRTRLNLFGSRRLVTHLYVLFRPYARMDRDAHAEVEVPFEKTVCIIDESDHEGILQICDDYGITPPDFIEPALQKRLFNPRW